MTFFPKTMHFSISKRKQKRSECMSSWEESSNREKTQRSHCAAELEFFFSFFPINWPIKKYVTEFLLYPSPNQTLLFYLLIDSSRSTLTNLRIILHYPGGNFFLSKARRTRGCGNHPSLAAILRDCQHEA